MNRLTPHEWMEKTMKDKRRKEEQRIKGIKDADSYLAESRIRGSIAKNRIRSKCYRGK